MSKKDRESMEELWSKRFDEEVDYMDEEPMSRKAKREREQSISPILTVTVIFLALLIILPISAYAWLTNRDDLSENPSSPSVEQQLVVEDDDEEPEEEVEEPEEVEEEIEEEPETIVEEEPEVEEPVAETPEPEQSTSQPSESDVSSNEQASDTGEQSSQNQSQSESSEEPQSQPEQTEPDQDAVYYEVQAGDNMYRIALNHGMTTDELMELNNVSDITVSIGQRLRVE